MRIDFTNDPRTLGEIALAYPELDHFHCVEVWVDSNGQEREDVFHKGIDRNPKAASKYRESIGLHGGYNPANCTRDEDGNEVEISEQGYIGSFSHCPASNWTRVVGDVAHGQ